MRSLRLVGLVFGVLVLGSAAWLSAEEKAPPTTVSKRIQIKAERGLLSAPSSFESIMVGLRSIEFCSRGGADIPGSNSR